MISETGPVAVRTLVTTLRRRQELGLEEAFRWEYCLLIGWLILILSSDWSDKRPHSRASVIRLKTWLRESELSRRRGDLCSEESEDSSTRAGELRFLHQMMLKYFLENYFDDAHLVSVYCHHDLFGISIKIAVITTLILILRTEFFAHS